MCHAADPSTRETHNKVEARMRQQLEEKERELMAEVAVKSKAAADAQVPVHSDRCARNVWNVAVDAGRGR